MTSDEGLDVYGATTWGQFFVYQGFNANCGWMHTSTGVDNVDEFAETIVTGPGGKLSYRYGDGLRPVATKPITLSYRTADGGHPGPAQLHHVRHASRPDRAPDGRQVDRLRADEQARRGAAAELPAHQGAQLLRTTSRWRASRPTAPTTRCSRTRGATSPSCCRSSCRSATTASTTASPSTAAIRRPTGKGLHSLESLPQAVNPQQRLGVQHEQLAVDRCRPGQPHRRRLPALLRLGSENDRGRHAVELLTGRNDFTPEALRDVAFDSYLLTFARLIPELIAAWDRLPDGRPAEGEARGADRAAARLGLPLGRGLDRDLAGRVLGRGAARRPTRSGSRRSTRR